jgi:hypothetical protein
MELIKNGKWPNIGANAAYDVNVQDQVSSPLIVNANKVNNTTSLSVATAIDDSTITVTDTTGFIDGAFIVIADVASNRYATFHQVGAVAGSVVTLDSPLDFAFPTTGTIVTAGTDNLAVKGDVTTQIFSLRASDPGIPLVVDITRIIFTCVCTSAVDLSKFCNFTALTNGLVLRRVDGTYQNIFNVKSNNDFASIMYDWQPFAKTNPVQGVDGFVSRLTFAGQNKIGVAIRLGPGEDLELLIQDDLATAQSTELITSLHATFEGHVVVD